MSEWNYTKCSKPFASHSEAKEYMVKRGFGGHILAREHGGYTAVCPTYPDGYYPDATIVESLDEVTSKQLSSGQMNLGVTDVSSRACCD